MRGVHLLFCQRRLWSPLLARKMIPRGVVVLHVELIMAFPEKQIQTAVKSKYACRKLTLNQCPRAVSKRNLFQGLIDKTTPANMWTGYSRDLFVTETCDALYEKLCSSLTDEVGKWQQTSIPPLPVSFITRDSFSAPCLRFAGMLVTPVTTAKTVVCSIWLWKITAVAEVQCIGSCHSLAKKQSVLRQ